MDAPFHSNTDDDVVTIKFIEIERTEDMYLFRKDDDRERCMIRNILQISRDAGEHLSQAARSENGNLALQEMKKAAKKLATFAKAIRVLDRHRHGDAQNVVVLRNGEAPPVGNATLEHSDMLIKEMFLAHVENMLEVGARARCRQHAQAWRIERFPHIPGEGGWTSRFEEVASMAQKAYVDFQGEYQDLERKRRQEIRVRGAARKSKQSRSKKPPLFLIAGNVNKARRSVA